MQAEILSVLQPGITNYLSQQQKIIDSWMELPNSTVKSYSQAVAANIW